MNWYIENKIEQAKADMQILRAAIKRAEDRIAKLTEDSKEFEKTIQLAEEERRSERSYAGKVTALRKKYPTLQVDKDPCDSGAKDVWDVSDSRIPYGVRHFDPWEGVHFCYGWCEVYNRVIDMLEYLGDLPHEKYNEDIPIEVGRKLANLSPEVFGLINPEYPLSGYLGEFGWMEKSKPEDVWDFVIQNGLEVMR